MGFEQAGFDVVAAVEIDPIHCAVHKFNFPECVVIPESVSAVTGNDIRSRAGIGSAKSTLFLAELPVKDFR